MSIGSSLTQSQAKKLAMLRKKSNQENKNSKTDTNNTSSFAQQRQKMNMNIPQLSVLTGISEPTLTRWETEGMSPNDKIDKITKYCKVLHLNLSDVVNQIMNQ